MANVIHQVRQQLTERRFNRAVAGQDQSLTDISDQYSAGGGIREIRAFGQQTRVTKSSKGHTQSTTQPASAHVKLVQIQLHNGSTFLWDADAQAVYCKRTGADGKEHRLQLPKTSMNVRPNGTVDFYDQQNDYQKPIVSESLIGDDVEVRVQPRGHGAMQHTYTVRGAGCPEVSCRLPEKSSDPWERKAGISHDGPRNSVTASLSANGKLKATVTSPNGGNITTFTDAPMIPVEWLRPKHH